ncbi:MAG TPA: hypothetical protein VKA74_02615, partial [Myxococcota bacterium]|nr:hypothetical protein [Myxococcota bacterium]
MAGSRKRAAGKTAGKNGRGRHARGDRRRGGDDEDPSTGGPSRGLLRARRVGLVVVALAFATGVWAAHRLLELDEIV